MYTLPTASESSVCAHADHEAIKLDDSKWFACEWRGLWELIEGDPPLACVNCACRSTIAREATAADIARSHERYPFLIIRELADGRREDTGVIIRAEHKPGAIKRAVELGLGVAPPRMTRRATVLIAVQLEDAGVLQPPLQAVAS